MRLEVRGRICAARLCYWRPNSTTRPSWCASRRTKNGRVSGIQFRLWCRSNSSCPLTFVKAWIWCKWRVKFQQLSTANDIRGNSSLLWELDETNTQCGQSAEFLKTVCILLCVCVRLGLSRYGKNIGWRLLRRGFIEVRGSCITRSFMICISHQMLWCGDQIMGFIALWGRWGMSVCFWWGNLKERATWKTSA